MLEKIGLPSKPSMRGGNWVVDASHCQGCSSQFTFINRKHHCRRCGGLFCNSCTQQRMVLRGQGDSPVRICNPCKNLEEAARFELRYGHKARAAKGSARQALKHEEVLSQILGTDAKQPLVSANEKHIDMVSDLLRTPSGSSASLQEEHAASSVSEAHIFQSSSVDVQSRPLNDIGSISPDELRQRGVDEKKKYKILKGEGKSDEALQAFKRGKELERQAAALEIAIRKSRRIVSKTSTLSSVLDTNKQVGSEETGSKKKQVTSRVHNDEKNDLASELRELGWSEADLNNEKKTAKLSLEGELSSLLGEIPRKASHAKGGTSVDKSLVIAHKKKALTFKREGKLAEAKEELKKAKILEKQIEEQELLGEEEDSEDELSALVNSMEDDDKHDDLLLDHGHGLSVNLHHLLGTANELASDGDFDVTDEDMNDPELAAALKSFGWAEEDDVHADDIILKSALLDREAMMSKVLALKREALGQKRAGNASQAMDLLKKAKLLEREMEDMQLDGQTAAPESIKKTSPSQIFGESSIAVAENLHIKPPLGSKTVIQKELLAVKRKALALRREGRIEEAEEELKIAKVLEGQLEEMENAAKSPDVKPAKKNAEFNQRHKDGPGNLALEEGGVDADVTEQDMHDPALLSVLKNLGWQDEDDEATSMASKFAQPVKDHSYSPPVMPVKARKSKAEIQRELLGLKRKALALRRQGKTEEADEELERAKALEQQIAEMEVSHGISFTKVESNAQEEVDKKNAGVELKATVDIGQKNDHEKAKPPGTSSPPVSDSHSQGKSGPAESWLEDWVSGSSKSAQPVGGLDPLPHNESKVLLVDNKKLAQKEDSESRNLSQVNAFTNLSDQINVKEDISTKSDSIYQSVSRAQMNDRHESKAAPNDRLVLPEQKSKDGDDNIKDEILAHKKRALALKREGKLAEAREELRQAKLLEKSLEDSQQQEVDSRSTPALVLDGTPVVQEESKPKQTQKPMSSRNRLKLQQESLAHKRNALKLRREGKIAESEAELELSKALESQLAEFGDEGSGASKGAAGDVIVEDLLDPQLMLALKSIGWNNNDMLGQSSKNPEPKPDAGKGGKSAIEKAHLEEQIRNEKINALNLKREGKQAEALEALRTAKRLEKKLASLNS